jgi:hypothetical protein
MSSKKDPTSVASKGINVDRYDLLNKIDSPADLRKLPESKLPKLVDQIREFLIDVTSKTGGHLAPGLGGRIDDCTSLPLRYSGRPNRVGYRTSGISSQDHNRSAGTDAHDTQAGWN